MARKKISVPEVDEEICEGIPEDAEEQSGDGEDEEFDE